jgi:RecA-family ATPase
MADSPKIDLDDFDEIHQFYKSIRYNFSAHSKTKIINPKYWMIPRWLGSKDLTVVFGASEAGKSVFAVDMACRLAAGFDYDGNQIGRYNVLYMAAERSAQVRRRIDAFVKHHGGEPFDNLVVYDGPIDLTADPTETIAIVRAAYWALVDDDPDSIDVVFIDTLAAAMSASDSSPDAMAAATSTLIAITRHGQYEDSGCAVVAVHHTPVSGEARLRGGGQLQGAADMTIHVTRKRGVSTAKVAKNNESADRASLSYTMETVPLVVDEYGIETTAPVLVKVAEPTKVLASASRIPKAERDANAVLERAVAEHGGPVTEDHLRDIVYAEAGTISESGKRKRFTRLLANLQAENGLYFKRDGTSAGQNGTNVQH